MSLFKRLFGERDDLTGSGGQLFRAPVHSSGIKSMGSNLQKKFSRGVQYNMKIVIRGDRNVGKSALLARLKGLEFCDQYIPTDEIEVASIHWNYKTNDVVKVEVWDVVDKGRKKKPAGLKLENSSATEDSSICLDAEFLDVYKGAHAVILVLDITKSWTYNYVERELQLVPDQVPVLVLGNHRDMGSHRTVSVDQIQTLVESVPGFDRGLVKYWESSMKNGYGLIYIHRFFNIPFLQLQKDTLLKQLATNEQEMSAALQEIEELEEEPESVYDNFIANLKQAKSVAHSQKPSSLSLHSNPVSQINSPTTPGSISQGPPHKASPNPTTISDNSASSGGGVSNVSDRAPIQPPQARPIPGMDKLGLYPLPVPTRATPSAATTPATPGVIGGGIFVGNTVNTGKTILSNEDGYTIPVAKQFSDRRDIDEFVPDEHPELSSFLDESASKRSPNSAKALEKMRELSLSSTDDDIDYGANGDGDGGQGKLKRHNPMVAAFDDDIEIDDGIVAIGLADSSVVDIGGGDQSISSDDSGVNDFRGGGVNGPLRHSNSKKLVSTFSVPLHSIANKSESIGNAISENKENGDSNRSNAINGYDTNAMSIIESKTSGNAGNQDKVSAMKELDLDDVTLHSNSSTKKKKKKKHHKDTENNNESHSRRKKKKKSRTRSEDSSSLEIAKSAPQNVATASKKSDDVCKINHPINRFMEPDLRDERSDSLERFLND